MKQFQWVCVAIETSLVTTKETSMSDCVAKETSLVTFTSCTILNLGGYSWTCKGSIKFLYSYHWISYLSNIDL